jgi:hypothetical protein
MKTHLFGVEFFNGYRRTDGRKDEVTAGQTDRHDKANCGSSQFVERAYNYGTGIRCLL